MNSAMVAGLTPRTARSIRHPPRPERAVYYGLGLIDSMQSRKARKTSGSCSFSETAI
jgi:hypothetical protein